MKQILIYPGDASYKTATLTHILQDMNIACTILDDTALSQRIGYLMQLKDYEQLPIQPQHATHDLMILRDVNDAEITQLNAAMKEHGIVMERKAMLTTHNKDWLLCDLMAEIEREHHYFSVRDALYSILKDSEHLIIEHYTADSWKRYEKAFYQAYEAISNDLDITSLERVYHQLCDTKAQLQLR